MFIVGMMLLLGIIGEGVIIGIKLAEERRAEKFEAEKRRNWNNAWI